MKHTQIKLHKLYQKVRVHYNGHDKVHTLLDQLFVREFYIMINLEKELKSTAEVDFNVTVE